MADKSGATGGGWVGGRGLCDLKKKSGNRQPRKIRIQMIKYRVMIDENSGNKSQNLEWKTSQKKMKEMAVVTRAADRWGHGRRPLSLPR